MDLAEVEIVVECDEKETCDFIEERMPAGAKRSHRAFHRDGAR